MIALATYLSLNLWIRGIFQFMLTLFIIALINIDYTFKESLTLISIGSKISLGIFLIIFAIMIVGMIMYFSKKKAPEIWPKGILEFYEPLKTSRKSVLSYNILFVIKRIIFAFNVVWLGFLSANTQLMVQVVTLIVALIISIISVRFKSYVTLIIYYVTEVI
jgi:hypothetical protein